MSSLEKHIFKQASTTYYWSSVFFPKVIRGDVFKLYSFVRLADTYADTLPQQRAAFRALRKAWATATVDVHFNAEPSSDDTADERAVKNMIYVQRKHGFDEAWIISFLDSMQADLDGKTYQTLDDTLWYIHGSAEVIGLMMAKIMNLSPEAYEAARLQGRAMQYINFIRDIQEDTKLGRCYFPREDLEQFDLADLTQSTAEANKTAFKKFIQFELQRYHEWQAAATEGFRHIPRRQRIAVRTAVDMYNWTSEVIARNPRVVFERQVKPHRRRVVARALRHLLG